MLRVVAVRYTRPCSTNACSVPTVIQKGPRLAAETTHLNKHIPSLFCVSLRDILGIPQIEVLWSRNCSDE